jgi:TPR repeat protein
LEDAKTAYDRGDYTTAMLLLRPLAENGNAESQYRLGVMYAEGQGIVQDYAEAAKWFRKAADQGVAEAQFRLGAAYWRGQGVPKDSTEAMKWLRDAADQGHVDGQISLGILYQDEQSPILSYMWFKLASAHGVKSAIQAYGYLSRQMTPSQIAEAQQLASKWKPALQPSDSGASVQSSLTSPVTAPPPTPPTSPQHAVNAPAAAPQATAVLGNPVRSTRAVKPKSKKLPIDEDQEGPLW